MGAKGSGTEQDPWVLKTPPGTSEYQMWRDEGADPPTLVCVRWARPGSATSSAASRTCTRC
jgi:hypothetical protein